MKKYYLLIFAVLFLSSCEPLTPVPENLSAIIAEIQGDDVTVRHANANEFQPAQMNETLAVRSQVSTGVESRTKLDLSSGTVIRVGPESVFVLKTNHEAEQGLLTRIKVDVGQIWIVLVGGELEVEMPSGLAGVRGSYMSAGFNPESGEVRVTCLEGHCSAENEAGSVEFTAGEAADLPAGGAAPIKGEMTAKEFQMWAENVPEASGLIPISCSVTSTFLYVRECPATACATLGHAVSGDELQLAFQDDKDGWVPIIFEGETGWINGHFCQDN